MEGIISRAEKETFQYFDCHSQGPWGQVCAAIYRPFEKIIHTTLPAKVAIAGERFAVVVEE